MQATKDKNCHIDVATDVLANVLRFMGLWGQVFCSASLSSPWALSIPADNMTHFHYVERGTCRLRLEDQDTDRTLSAGEIAVLPHGSGHLLYDAPGGSLQPISELIERSPQHMGCAIVEFGGKGEHTQMLCGSFQFREGRGKILLPSLPQVMVLLCRGGESQLLLELVLRAIETESKQQQPGAELVLSRLVEILFVNVLRAWINTRQEKTEAQWLSALKDERIAEAMSALHADPGYPWTLERLAGISKMSRSPFAALFKQAVGEAPLTYLKRWRTYLASDLLEDSNLALKEIAGRVGYQSEASFSKAFKQATGFSPGQWRRRHKDRETQSG